MKTICKTLLLVTISILYSCIEEYEDDNVSKEPQLIVDAFITDLTPKMSDPNNDPGEKFYSYVKLTISKSFLISDYDDSTLITDAIVVIKDDLGQVDTLRQIGDLKYKHQSIEWPDTGIFRLQQLKPSAGRTYYLEVYYKQQKYTAVTYMPKLPKVDSIQFIYTSLPSSNPFESVSTTNIAPKIFFVDPPNESNYYLFKFLPNAGWCNNVMSDQYINSTSGKGIDGFYNNNPDNANEHTHFFQSPVYLLMGSINKEAYNYLEILHSLYMTDGGNFSPAPASPKGNIEGNALGLFYASSCFAISDDLPSPVSLNTPEGANLMTLFPNGKKVYTRYGTGY